MDLGGSAGWIECRYRVTIEKIGKTPDIKSKSTADGKVGAGKMGKEPTPRRAMNPSPKKDKEFLTQDAAKGTPVAGRPAPIGHPPAFDRLGIILAYFVV